MSAYLLKRDYLVLYLLLVLVYLSGLWIPLMENDSAQHAVMAMRMYLENDFVNLYKGGEDYLDKPHMHFWLSAISFKLFGVSQFAYRIPALLFTILGAYSCNRLAKEFYGDTASHVASLVFLSTQAIFLSNHDVRTDAVLTGTVIFGIWQLILFINYQKLIHIILGAIGVALAFSTKGQLGVFFSGVCVISYLWYAKKWNVLWSWRLLVGILVFVFAITPVLYAYYLQFDMHPGKIINGKANISGIRFILWDQSFDRLTASGFEETGSDYFFFFHTLLWAFLPWSLIGYLALFHRCKTFLGRKFRYISGTEILTSVGVLIILIVISFSKFKLPHYLNSLFPILAVLVSGYITELHQKNRRRVLKVLVSFQYVVLTLGTVFILFLIFWAFSMPHVGIILCYLFLLVGLCFLITTSMVKARKLVITSVYFMILINFCLHTQFYPRLLLYQAGNNTAKIIQSENIEEESVFRLAGRPSWSLDFYTKRITPILRLDFFNAKHTNKWLFVYQDQIDILKERDIHWSKQYEINHYRITRLNIRFLNPNTRNQILEKAYLLKLE